MADYQRYRVYDGGIVGKLRIGGDDRLVQLINAYSNLSPVAGRRGIRGVAFEFLDDMKKHIASGKLSRLSTVQKGQWLDRLGQRRGLRYKQYAGDFKRGKRGIQRMIKVDGKDLYQRGIMRIGFDKDGQKIGTRFQAGYVKPVTDKSRATWQKAYNFAKENRRAKFRQLPFRPVKKNKKSIKVKGRPFVQPVWDANKIRYERVFIDKFTKKLAEIRTRAAIRQYQRGA